MLYGSGLNACFQGGFLAAQSGSTAEIRAMIEASRIEADRSMARRTLEGRLHLYSDEYAIDFISIAELDRSELRILRNLIFARYGYAFRSEDLRSYFLRFEWYNPRFNHVDDDLSVVDTMNIGVIRAFESMDASTQDVITPDEMRGLWHVSLVMPSSYSLVFQFYEDRRFAYHYSRMAQVPEIDSFSGTFEIQGNTIRLNFEQVTLYENSGEVEFNPISGYQWTERERVTVASNDVLVFPVKNLQTIGDLIAEGYRYPPELADREVVTIGNVPFYKVSSDPDYYWKYQ
jgi:hypothetical protein